MKVSSVYKGLFIGELVYRVNVPGEMSGYHFKWLLDKFVADKIGVDKITYGQNGTNKIINQSIPLPTAIRLFRQSRFQCDPFRFPLHVCYTYMYIFMTFG